MRIAHFIDLDVLINVTEKAWIISKERPNLPIMVISKVDFKLFKSGIYKLDGNSINFNGQTFWLPNDFYNKLKVLINKKNIDITKLAISLRPMLDSELLASMPYSFDFSILDTLKNKSDDIYIISKSISKTAISIILDEFLIEVKDMGLNIKNVYYIEDFNTNLGDIDDFEVRYKTQKILLQHSIGFKTEMREIILDEIEQYDIIKYYSKEFDTLDYPLEVNHILDELYNNSADNIKRVIRDEFQHLKLKIVAYKYSSNELNKCTNNAHLIKLNGIMSLESFLYNKGKEDTF